jgi:hypothetical protein
MVMMMMTERKKSGKAKTIAQANGATAPRCLDLG